MTGRMPPEHNPLETRVPPQRDSERKGSDAGVTPSTDKPYPGKGNGASRKRGCPKKSEHAVLDYVIRDDIRVSQAPLEKLEDLLAEEHHFEDNLFFAIERTREEATKVLAKLFKVEIVSSECDDGHDRACLNLLSRCATQTGACTGYDLHIAPVRAHVQMRIMERLPWFIPRTQLTLRCLPGLSLQGSEEYYALARRLVQAGIGEHWNMVHYDSGSDLVAIHLGDYYGGEGERP